MEHKPPTRPGGGSRPRRPRNDRREATGVDTQERPRPPQDRPRGSQDRPRGSQDRPRGSQDWPRGSQDRPRLSPVELAATALKALSTLVRALATEYGLTPGESLPTGKLVLPLSVDPELFRSAEVTQAAAVQLVNDTRRRVQEGMEAIASFRLGRVYCYQCRSADCVHGAPENPAQVFCGFSATGKPMFKEFANLCLERGDERVDRIYADVPEVVAIAQEGADLKGEMLPAFGRDSVTYNVHGQVVAGLVPSDLGLTRTPPHRVALTFQLVETGSGTERRRLRLNLLGLTPEAIGAAAGDSAPLSPASALAQIVRTTRQKIDAVGRLMVQAERMGKRMELAPHLSPILTWLKADLERAFRPRTYRTSHAVERHSDGDRPIRNALTDVERASDERFYLDSRSNAIVVLGPRARAHVFSLDGRLVTSIQLDPGELDRKIRQQRWVPVEPAKVKELRSRILLEKQGE